MLATQPMKCHILVVEDDPDINTLIKLNLESMNHKVTSSLDGYEGYELAQAQSFDLIVLDLMLPNLDGLSFCQMLRNSACYTPILMLTAKKSEADRVTGLELGADDYLTKPFSIRELQARVKAQLRRSAVLKTQEPKEPDEPCLNFGDLAININRREVTLQQNKVELTATEFELLLYLAQHPGRVYTREKLLNAVWGYKHSGYEHTVNSHINRLRTKLERNPSKPDYVLTVWGVGYKFNDAINH